MRRLAQRIKQELQTAKHCAVYKEELTRIWPSDTKQREALVANFASERGWGLRYCSDGFCAMFDYALRKPS